MRRARSVSLLLAWVRFAFRDKGIDRMKISVVFYSTWYDNSTDQYRAQRVTALIPETALTW